MSKPTELLVPVALLQGLYEYFLAREKAGDESEEVDHFISALNCGLLDANVHPQQLLVDAGLYKATLED